MSYWDGTRWVADDVAPPPRRRPVRHLLGAVAEATVVTALIFGLIAGSAFGARGGNSSKGGHGGGGSTATISVPDGVYMGTVTATVSPAGLWVKAACYQDNVMVYGQYIQSDANGQATLNLGPTSWWTGGPATCTAEAGGWSSRSGAWTAQGSTTFNVSG